MKKIIKKYWLALKYKIIDTMAKYKKLAMLDKTVILYNDYKF